MTEQLNIFGKPLEGLVAARRRVEEGLDAGIECPCCGQYCKRYNRKLNSGMAATLCWLVARYRSTGALWVHVQAVGPRYVVRSNEIGKLVHWALVEQRICEPGGGASLGGGGAKTSGLWRPTERGEAFVDRRIVVPSHVQLFDNNVHGFSTTTVLIDDALGERFSYTELMAAS